MGAHSLRALTLLSSNQLVFVNVDHAPMGVCSSMSYGFKNDVCGIGTSTAIYPYWNPSGGGGGGVLVGLSGPAGLQVLPFLNSASALSAHAQFFTDAALPRGLTPCTDDYTVAGGALTFTHYTPAWPMTDFDAATLSEKKRCFLPATWLVFTINNTNSTPIDFYFGLPVPVAQRSFANGAYQGFALGEAALAVQAGACDVWSGATLTATLDGMTNGGAFHLAVPAGQTQTLVVVLAFYRSAVVDTRTGSSYYYTALYPSIDSVIDAAFAGLGDARLRCQQMAEAMDRAGLNPYRRFLACHGLHSYMADTACLIDPQGRVHWWEMEGIFNYINTFDLTVDHAFFDACIQPWALRNVLDAFSGALPGTGYSYDTPLYSSTSGVQVSTHGFSFHHDMGHWPTSGTGPAYGANMGLEELQAWILCAGLYWSHTADHAWLTNNTALLQACLNSLLLRDDTNAVARDGITKNVNSGEITTYDSLDVSLLRPGYSGRMAVRNWASYLALNAMFNQVGDAADAATCQNMAAVAAQTIASSWDTYSPTLGYIPAMLNGSVTTAIIPMVEGLAYPAAMGLTNAIDRVGGPYAPMLHALSNHLAAVLVPGRCLDATCGAWRVSSASTITWQSKVFICQYVAEAVLGITNSSVNGAVDQIHASMQIQDAPFVGYADSFNATGVFKYADGVTYPRGVSSAIWWLNANPVPSTGSNISAWLGGAGLTVSWPPAYTGWILQTNGVGLSNPAAWADVPESRIHSEMIFPAAGPSPPATFFRLRHP